MCGLFGYALNENSELYLKNEEYKAFNIFMSNMFDTGILRGRGGSGMYTARNLGERDEVFYFKKAVIGPDFNEYRYAQELLSKKAAIKVGHVRAATVGDISTPNCHPFFKDDIILVHNGTLSSWYGLSKAAHKVDSEAMTYNIAEHGIKESLEKHVIGDYTINMFDMSEDKLYLVRNESRPLHIAWLKDNAGLVWSSEHLHLMWLLDRTGISQHVASYNQPKEGEMLVINRDSLERIDLDLLTPKGRKNYWQNVTGGSTTRGSGNIIPLDNKKPIIKEGQILLMVPEYKEEALKHYENYFSIELRGMGKHFDTKVDVYPDNLDTFIKKYKITHDLDLNSGWYTKAFLVLVDSVHPGYLGSDYFVEIPEELKNIGGGRKFGRHLTKAELNELFKQEGIQALCKELKSEYLEFKKASDGAISATEDDDVPFEEGEKVEFNPTVIGPYGRKMSFDVFKRTHPQLTCSWCSDQISDSSIVDNEVMWENDNPLHDYCFEQFLASFVN